MDASALTFRAGSPNKRVGGQILNVKQYINHPNYNDDNLENDYALVELTKPITFTQSMKPIRLPSADYAVKDGSTCLVSGWGNTYANVDPNLLRATEVYVINQERCQRSYDELDEEIFDSMLCAGWHQGGKDACQVKF